MKNKTKLRRRRLTEKRRTITATSSIRVILLFQETVKRTADALH